MFKQTLLNNFIDQYRHLPIQGSDEWKELRKNFIGGSELSSILKQNKNKSVNKLVLEKLGFDRFTGNVITHWGNVFEELIRLHCEDTFACSILETGSIPYEEGYLSYSPDGLSNVPTNKLIQQFGSLPDGLDKTASTQLVLFEFKCPHSRVPTHTIPDHYWPQVNVGMNIIDIMETAVFVQATYRRCSFDMLKYNKYHNGYGHFKKADITNPPIEYGFMTIYADEEKNYHIDLKKALIEFCDASEVYLNNGQIVLDIGNVTEPAVLEEIFGNCVKKIFQIDYCFRQMYNQEVFNRGQYVMDMYDESLQFRAMEKLQQQTEKHKNIIGILPFKLLNVYMTSVAKNSNYIKETDVHTKAINVLQCIKDHRDIDNKSDVSKSIRKYKL